MEPLSRNPNRSRDDYKTAPRFMTAGIAADVESNKEFAAWINDCLTRYVNEDWGEMAQDDKDLNDISRDPDNPGRILAAYSTPDFDPIYIITEWTREATTIMYKSEY